MVKDTIARIKINNKHFEVVVDLEPALKFRKGENINLQSVLLSQNIFTNSKDGTKASNEDLEQCFATSDLNQVAERIIKKGEIQLPKEFRDEQQENKKKKIIDFYVRNAMDAKTSRPFTL